MVEKSLLQKVKDLPVFKRRTRTHDMEEFVERQKKRGYLGALQHVDGTPMAPPIGYQPRESIFELVKRQVEHQLSEAARADQETFEEADDFEIDEPWANEAPRSPYENDLEPSVKELLAAGHKAIADKKARQENKADPAARTAPEPLKSGAETAVPPKAGVPASDE